MLNVKRLNVERDTLETSLTERARSVKSFEDLRVFQEARELSRRVHALTRNGQIAKDFVLIDQMRRAVLSIVSNIAEGFERQSKAEFVRFLYIAKGSCGELRAQALVTLDEGYWTKEVHAEIDDKCRKLSSGLSNFISYLEKSEVVRRQRRG
jgi:four helix bundle protein